MDFKLSDNQFQKTLINNNNKDILNFAPFLFLSDNSTNYGNISKNILSIKSDENNYFCKICNKYFSKENVKCI